MIFGASPVRSDNAVQVPLVPGQRIVPGTKSHKKWGLQNLQIFVVRMEFLTPQEIAEYSALFQLGRSGYFIQSGVANFYSPPPPEELEKAANEVTEAKAKRRKSATQAIFDEADWSPLQKSLGCIRSKTQAKKFDFVEFIAKLKDFNPIISTSLHFQNYSFRILQGLKEFLNWKNLTLTGIRSFSERVPPSFFLQYIWCKSAKKWCCTAKYVSEFLFIF